MTGVTRGEGKGRGERAVRAGRLRLILSGLVLLTLVPALVLFETPPAAAAWIDRLPQPGNWGLIMLGLLGVVIGRIGFRRARRDQDR